MKKINIYQPYRTESELAQTENEFIPVLNKDDNPFWHYNNYKNMQKLAIKAKSNLWGCFGLNWRELLPGFTVENVHNYINENPDNDVYTFTAYSFLDGQAYNVWEQGQWCHPKIVTIMDSILPLMGLSADIITQPMTLNEMSYGQCFIGNTKFWTGYLKFLDNFVAACDKLAPEDKALLNSQADGQSSESYVPYILERLLATYLMLEKTNLNIMPCSDIYERYLNDEMLSRIQQKYDAVEENDTEALQQWVATRQINPGNYNWAGDWLK